MMTQTHLLLNAAVFTRADAIRANLAALAAAIVPDLSIYVLAFWARVVEGVPEATVWRELYWQEPWQTLGAVTNSVPLYAALLVFGLARKSVVLTTFAAGALLHMLGDFLVHHDDAHRHFWPFTDWRFRSPVSYWDPAHHGHIFMWFEFALALVCIGLLWRRFETRWVRGLLLLLLVPYVAVPIYFGVQLAGG